MSKRNVETSNKLVQTTIQCFPYILSAEDDSVKVISNRSCQTAASTAPDTKNTNFYPLLEFIPYELIVDDSIKELDLPRKALLQWKLPNLKDTLSNTTTESSKGPERQESDLSKQRGVLKKNSDTISVVGFSRLLSPHPFTMQKGCSDQGVQTVISVLPHVLDTDEVANVYTELSIQTSITCLPNESISNILPQLKGNLPHTGVSSTQTYQFQSASDNYIEIQVDTIDEENIKEAESDQPGDVESLESNQKQPKAATVHTTQNKNCQCHARMLNKIANKMRSSNLKIPSNLFPPTDVFEDRMSEVLNTTIAILQEEMARLMDIYADDDCVPCTVSEPIHPKTSEKMNERDTLPLISEESPVSDPPEEQKEIIKVDTTSQTSSLDQQDTLSLISKESPVSDPPEEQKEIIKVDTMSQKSSLDKIDTNVVKENVVEESTKPVITTDSVEEPRISDPVSEIDFTDEIGSLLDTIPPDSSSSGETEDKTLLGSNDITSDETAAQSGQVDQTSPFVMHIPTAERLWAEVAEAAPSVSESDNTDFSNETPSTGTVLSGPGFLSKGTQSLDTGITGSVSGYTDLSKETQFPETGSSGFVPPYTASSKEIQLTETHLSGLESDYIAPGSESQLGDFKGNKRLDSIPCECQIPTAAGAAIPSLSVDDSPSSLKENVNKTPASEQPKKFEILMKNSVQDLKSVSAVSTLVVRATISSPDTTKNDKGNIKSGSSLPDLRDPVIRLSVFYKSGKEIETNIEELLTPDRPVQIVLKKPTSTRVDNKSSPVSNLKEPVRKRNLDSNTPCDCGGRVDKKPSNIQPSVSFSDKPVTTQKFADNLAVERGPPHISPIIPSTIRAATSFLDEPFPARLTNYDRKCECSKLACKQRSPLTTPTTSFRSNTNQLSSATFQNSYAPSNILRGFAVHVHDNYQQVDFNSFPKSPCQIQKASCLPPPPPPPPSFPPSPPPLPPPPSPFIPPIRKKCTCSRVSTPNYSPKLQPSTPVSNFTHSPTDTEVEFTTFNSAGTSEVDEEKAMSLTYEDDAIYEEPYMATLTEDDTSTAVQTELVLGDKLESDSLNSLIKEELEECICICTSKTEIPWENISLAPPGSYNIKSKEKSQKEEEKEKSESDKDKTENDVYSTLSEAEGEEKRKSKSDKEETADEVRNTLSEAEVEEKEKSESDKQKTEDDVDSTLIEAEYEDKRKSKSDKEETDDGVHNTLGEAEVEEKEKSESDKDETENDVRSTLSEAEGISKDITPPAEPTGRKKEKLLFEDEVDKHTEPYMEGLYKDFPNSDDEDGDCGSSTEMPWKDIILPENCKIKKIKKNKKCICRSNVQTLSGMFLPPQTSPKVEDNDEGGIIEIHMGFEEAPSCIISVGGLKNDIVPKVSTCSNIAQIVKRSPKEYVLRVDLQKESNYSVSFHSGQNKMDEAEMDRVPGSCCQLDCSKQVTEGKTSSFIVNIKPSTECPYASQKIPVTSKVSSQMHSGTSRVSCKAGPSACPARRSTSMPAVYSQRSIKATVLLKGIEDPENMTLSLTPGENYTEFKLDDKPISLSMSISTANQEGKSRSSGEKSFDPSTPPSTPPSTGPSTGPSTQTAEGLFVPGRCACKDNVKPDTFKEDPVMAALEAYEAEMKPLRQALTALQQKIRNLNMPEMKGCMCTTALLNPPPPGLTPSLNIIESGPSELEYYKAQNPYAAYNPNQCLHYQPPTLRAEPKPLPYGYLPPPILPPYRQNYGRPPNYLIPSGGGCQKTCYCSRRGYDSSRNTNPMSTENKRHLTGYVPPRGPSSPNDLSTQARYYGMYPDYRGKTYPNEEMAYHDSCHDAPSRSNRQRHYKVRHVVSMHSSRNSDYDEYDSQDLSDVDDSYCCREPTHKRVGGRCSGYRQNRNMKTKISKVSNKSNDFDNCMPCKDSVDARVFKVGQAVKTDPDEFLLPCIMNKKSQGTSQTYPTNSGAKVHIKVPSR